jgi:hypothetical protein
MSFNSEVFLITQRQIVIAPDGTNSRFFMPHFSKPIQIHRGVDNQVSFQFLNSDQRAVNVTGKEITLRIIDSMGKEILLSKTLDMIYALTGLVSLQLNIADLENIPPQKAHFSLEIKTNGLDLPVYLNQSGLARGEMDILDSVLPSFSPSVLLSIPTGQHLPDPNANINSPETTYFSSVLLTKSSPTLTIQTEYSAYTGDVTIQGSSLPDADWYPIRTDHFPSQSGTIGINVDGFHPYIRMSFVSNCGQVLKILTR